MIMPTSKVALISQARIYLIMLTKDFNKTIPREDLEHLSEEELQSMVSEMRSLLHKESSIH